MDGRVERMERMERIGMVTGKEGASQTEALGRLDYKPAILFLPNSSALSAMKILTSFLNLYLDTNQRGVEWTLCIYNHLSLL